MSARAWLPCTPRADAVDIPQLVCAIVYCDYSWGQFDARACPFFSRHSLLACPDVAGISGDTHTLTTLGHIVDATGTASTTLRLLASTSTTPSSTTRSTVRAAPSTLSSSASSTLPPSTSSPPRSASSSTSSTVTRSSSRSVSPLAPSRPAPSSRPRAPSLTCTTPVSRPSTRVGFLTG